MRMKNVNGTTCDVFVEEETSGDDETNHVDEVVGYFAIMTPKTLTLELEDHCDTPPEIPCTEQLINCT